MLRLKQHESFHTTQTRIFSLLFNLSRSLTPTRPRSSRAGHARMLLLKTTRASKGGRKRALLFFTSALWQSSRNC